MKIVLATTAPRHWGPQLRCLAEILHARGHQVTAASSLPPGTAPLACDVLFCLGTGESLLPFLEAAPQAAKVLYLLESIPTLRESDDFTRVKLQVHRDYLNIFDVVLVHTPRSVPLLRELGVSRIRTMIWPHFPSLFAPQEEVVKDLDVLFVGAPSPYREKILESVRHHHRLTVVQDAFHAEAEALYARAKIALNIHYTPLRNLECRVIEALGCRAFLLTEELDPPRLLRDGQHLVVFTPEKLPELLDHYLADAAARARIAGAGHVEIQRYAISARAADLENVLLEALCRRQNRAATAG